MMSTAQLAVRAALTSAAALLLLSACASAPTPPAQLTYIQSCPPVTRCYLPAANPRTNGELNLLLERTEAAWQFCAAQVDMIAGCQASMTEKQ